MGRRDKPAAQTKIAEERVEILFREAATMFSERPELAHRYVFLARKLAMKFNVKLISEQRRSFCHKCYHFLVPGKNCVVRTNPQTKCIEYHCLDCKQATRFGYSREKKLAKKCCDA